MKSMWQKDKCLPLVTLYMFAVPSGMEAAVITRLGVLRRVVVAVIKIYMYHPK